MDTGTRIRIPSALAICYAALKRTLTGKEYEPCRAGNVNPETQFVLDFFQVEAPRLVESVKTQVKDIEIRKTKGVDRGISLKTAWSLMQENNVVTIPCVTEEGVLEGSSPSEILPNPI